MQQCDPQDSVYLIMPPATELSARNRDLILTICRERNFCPERKRASHAQSIRGGLLRLGYLEGRRKNIEGNSVTHLFLSLSLFESSVRGRKEGRMGVVASEA